jgi:demethylspheroidene O-methyltransferase
MALPVSVEPLAAAVTADPVAGWRDRWLAWRDRTLASRRFKRWAAAFLPTRGISRRRARAVFDLVAGFTYSQVLLACVRLRLFDILFERPRTLVELSATLTLSEDATQRLLAAAISLRLVEARHGNRFGLGPLGAPLVGDSAIAAMVEHHGAFYADLADPVALLRGKRSELASYWPYATASDPSALNPQSVAAYSALMSASQPLVADEILAAYPFSRHRRLLDVGGGEATFLMAAARRAPQLGLMLFDLPAVVERARERLTQAGLAARAELTGGDFGRDDLPQGADIATLIRVIHDHDDDRALTILRKVARALGPGGTLLLAEPMAGTVGAEPMGDAYFGWYLLAMGSGRPRSAVELKALLAAAGFTGMRLLRNPMPLQTQLLLARVAAAVNP